MSRALVLNASYEPLCVVPARRALILVLSDKAELVHTTDRMYHAERIAVPEPSVVRLCYYVKVPYQARVALKRFNCLNCHNTQAIQAKGVPFVRDDSSPILLHPKMINVSHIFSQFLLDDAENSLH